MDDTEIAREKTGEESEKKEEKLNFDAFQGLVLDRTLTEEGRIRKVTILTQMRLLENEGATVYESDFRKSLLAVEFGPDGNDLPRERDFPPFCLVKGRVESLKIRPIAERRVESLDMIPIAEGEDVFYPLNPGEAAAEIRAIIINAIIKRMERKEENRGQVSRRVSPDIPGYLGDDYERSSICPCYRCACVPGSFALVRDGSEELALMEALHEDADDHLRRAGEPDLAGPRISGSVSSDPDDPDPNYSGYSAEQKEIFWLRFFLRRSRLRLTEAGFLRKGQRSRRLHGDWSETRIISEEESGLPGVVLAVLTGCPQGIPRILACGAPAPGAVSPWLRNPPLGSHNQGWYAPEAFCAVSIGSAPRILEGRITVPEERLADLFAWIRANRGVLFHLWRMGAHQAATWSLAGLRALADCPKWKPGDDAAKDGSKAFWAAVKRTLGDALRADELLCTRLWAAVADTTWLHGDGLEAGFSSREAGRMIAELREEEGENCMRFMPDSDGMVHSEIALALEPEGWFWGWCDNELIGHGAAECDIRNDCARDYRERRDYFPSEEAAEKALRRVKRLWNALTGGGKRARTGRRPSSGTR